MQTAVSMDEPNAREIVALDVDTNEAALDLVSQLGAAARFYKVGLQLLTAPSPAVVRELVARGKYTFLDFKLHEIPTAVAHAVRAAGALGVKMVMLMGSRVRRCCAQQSKQPYLFQSCAHLR